MWRYSSKKAAFIEKRQHQDTRIPARSRLKESETCFRVIAPALYAPNWCIIDVEDDTMETWAKSRVRPSR